MVVVIDPWALLDEIKEIKKKGVEVNSRKLYDFRSASLILNFIKKWMKLEKTQQENGKLELQEEELER